MLSLPRQRLLGLVCGLPGDRRRLRGLLVLQAYIDGSGGRDRAALILAGYVATVEQWLPFTDEWDAKLKQAGKPYVKMSEMASEPEFAAYFYKVIEQHVAAGIAFAIPIAPLQKVCDELGYPSDSPIRNPYYMASKGIINVTAQYQQHEIGLQEPINFIFDQQSEEGRIRRAWDSYVNGRIPPEVKALTGEKPLFLDDTKHAPLQAADIYAWWLRRKWEEGGMDAFLNQWPFPWTCKREFPRFMMALNENDIRVELTKLLEILDENRLIPFRLNVTFGPLKLDHD